MKIYCVVCAVGLILVAAWNGLPAAQSPGDGHSPNPSHASSRDSSNPLKSDAKSAGAKLRLREGMTLTDTVVEVRQDAEGLVFVDGEGRTLYGLENLNLQRILQTLRRHSAPDDLQWKISASVTEFEGRNYVLVSRATYMSRTTSRPSATSQP